MDCIVCNKMKSTPATQLLVISHVSTIIKSNGTITHHWPEYFSFYCLIKSIMQYTKWWMHLCECMCIYSSANKFFAVLRRNRSDPLSRAMGCIGELRAGSHSAGYERFGTGNVAPLAVLVPIPKPATHSKGASNQHPHCNVYIWMYHLGSH